MANMKRHFIAGKMNKSVDERLLPNGEYVDALNVRLGSTEASEIGSVENSKGNTQLTTLEFNGTALSNNAKCIGVYEDGTRETVYWFVHDPNFSAGAITKLDLIVSLNVNTDVLTYHVVSERNGATSKTTLNFNPTYLITGIDMVEDQLFFTDDYNAPRVIDIKKYYPAPSGGIDQFTDEEILVIKKPPIESPTISLNTIPGNEDFLEDRFLCFAYRYRYEGNQYSATSQFSKPAFAPQFFSVSISSFLNEGMQNDSNNVIISLDTGGPLVKGFDLLFKESNSNIIKVAQKFDKSRDGIADNVNFDYNFSGNKIFTILPDSELLRLFDNVPRFAQAQTIMGNRLMYGNYVEGYDIKDLSGQDVDVSYTTSLVSKEVSSLNIPSSIGQFAYSLDPAFPLQLIQDSGFTVDLSGISLIQGSIISFEFTLAHAAFTSPGPPAPNQQQPSIDINFEYILPQDFLTDGTSTGVYKLVNSPDFQEKLGTGLPSGTIKPVYDAVNPTSCEGFTLTDIINCRIENILTTAGATTYTKFVGGLGVASPTSPGDGIGDYVTAAVAVTDNSFSIQLPAMRRVDSVSTPTINVYEYFEASNVNMRFRSVANSLSLHSNRNYEVGIIYMDDFNRATTALVSTDNTVHTQCITSIDQNSIKVEIPTNQLAPSFATRYKFCVKPDKEGYRTIYSNFYVKDPSTSDSYILLEGENAQKVEEGDDLIVKRDATGAVSFCSTISVLDKQAQSSGFLDPAPQDSAGNNIPIPSGTYIKVSGNNINIDLPEGAIISPGRQSVSNNINSGKTPQLSYTGLSGEPDGLGNYTPPTIPEKTRIVLRFLLMRLGTGDGTNNCERRIYEYEQTFFASADYTDIIDWFNGDNIGNLLTLGVSETGDGSVITNTYLTPTDTSGPSASSPSYGIPFSTVINYYRWYRDIGGTEEIRFIIQGPQSCGSGGKKSSRISCEWQVFRSENLLVFETEPSDALPDVWYESSESYAIDQSTGYHQGSDGVYQTSTTPAIVETDFANCYSFGNGVESYRIRDSIKGKAFDLGERFFSTSAEDYKEADRFAGLTYSGVFNTETNVNKLNEFNLGLLNFKNLEESFGAIQILSGRDTDILTLQEDKISYVQSGRNLLSDAAGGSAVTSVPEVLGQQIARIEEYGISQNPESFVQYGYDKFFTDAKRGAVIQLRGIGKAENLTVISELGMRSWFRDLFIGKIDTQKLGAFDPYMNEYVLSSNDTELPIEPVVVNCGVQRRLTVTAASPESFTVNLGNTVGTCEIAYNIVSFADPAGSINISEDYTPSTTNVAATGSGVINFSKDSVANDDVIITLTPIASVPGGKQTVVLDISVGCPAAQEITLVTFCVTKPDDAGSFIHNEYQWTDAGPPVYLSPLQSRKVAFDIGTPTPTVPVLTDYTSITAPQGGGIIPNNGDVLSVISNKIEPGDNYRYRSASNRLMFCRSNTPYPNSLAGYTSLLTDPNLQVLTVTGSSPIFKGDTAPISGTEEYMYIIYDYFT